MSKRTVVLVSMTLANAMTLVDQTAVPLSLANIMRDFGVGSQSAQWVLSASLLHLACYLTLARSASDHGYIVAVLAVSVLALIGLMIVVRLVRKPTTPVEIIRVEEVGAGIG